MGLEAPSVVAGSIGVVWVVLYPSVLEPAWPWLSPEDDADCRDGGK